MLPSMKLLTDDPPNKEGKAGPILRMRKRRWSEVAAWAFPGPSPPASLARKCVFKRDPWRGHYIT